MMLTYLHTRPNEWHTNAQDEGKERNILLLDPFTPRAPMALKHRLPSCCEPSVDCPCACFGRHRQQTPCHIDRSHVNI